MTVDEGMQVTVEAYDALLPLPTPQGMGRDVFMKFFKGKLTRKSIIKLLRKYSVAFGLS